MSKCRRCGLPFQPDDLENGMSHVACDESEVSETWIDEQLADGAKDRKDFEKFWAKFPKSSQPPKPLGKSSRSRG